MLLDIYFWCIYVCVGVQLCSPTHALVNVYKPYDCPFIGSADNYTIAVICYKTHSAIALHMYMVRLNAHFAMQTIKDEG